MAKRSISPIATWILWSVVLLGTFLTVTWEFVYEGFAADTSKVTLLILVFFGYGFIASAIVAIKLQVEHKSLKAMDENQRIGDPNASDVSAMFDSAMERIRRGDRIEVRNLISAYAAKLKSRVDNLLVVSSMLITVGLLGTVMGLIVTITGLDKVLQSSNGDILEMRSGLNTAFTGMGTAFNTTFYGALLGGVVLKALSSEMKKATQILVADALRFSELFIAPQFQRSATESLVELEDQVIGLHRQLGSLSSSFGEAVETIDSKQTVLAGGLENLVATVNRTSELASERTEKLVDALSSSLEDTSRQADERLKAFTGALEQSNEQTAERANALIEAISQSTEATSRQADERIEAIKRAMEQSAEGINEQTSALVDAMNQSMDATNERLNASSAALNTSVEETGASSAKQLETVANAVQVNLEESSNRSDDRMEAMVGRIADLIGEADSKASERVELLTDSIAKTTAEMSRVADERLQTMIMAVDHATQKSNSKADEQLAGFVEKVEKSVEGSRKNAEERLNTRASDLAGKLNEAASMLSGLVANVEVPEDSNNSDEG